MGEKKQSQQFALHMVKRFLCELPLKAGLAVMQSGGEQYAKIFKIRQSCIGMLPGLSACLLTGLFVMML